MILVDTSVWIDHFRTADTRLAGFLEDGLVLAHPFVIGELALGSFRDPAAILGALELLPQADAATHEEVLAFVKAANLPGSGIGYVDAHLLASVRLTPDAGLWTRDKRLDAVASRLGLTALI